MSATLLALLLASPAGELPEWSHLEANGWTSDGAEVAWLGAIDSVDQTTCNSNNLIPAGDVSFLIVADAAGTIEHVFRSSYDTEYPEDCSGLDRSGEPAGARALPGCPWKFPGAAVALWERAESQEAGEHWTAAHALSNVELYKNPYYRDGKLESDPIALEDHPGVVVRELTPQRPKRRSFKAILQLSIGPASGSVFTDTVDSYGGSVILSPSPDGNHALVFWRVEAGPSGHRSHLGVFSRRSLTTFDLLDAGAGGGLEPLAAKLKQAGFREGHRGKSGAPHPETEVYFAAGFEAEAREVATLVGARPEAIRPLTWKSPFALTVAAAASHP